MEAALDELRPGLPGVEMDTVYRPATFIETMIENLTATLILGAILLLFVLGAFLFNWRTALVSLVTIATSVAATVLVLSWFGVGLNMMSLAGLVMALAIVVDDAVVGVDNITRHLRLRRELPAGEPVGDTMGVGDTIGVAVVQMRGPLLVAAVIAIVSVVPLLILDGVSGAFLTPVALGFLVATAVSLVVALTVAPALATLLLSRTSVQRRESPLARGLERAYAGLLPGLLRRSVWPYATLGLLVVAGLISASFLGGRPVSPTLQERDLLISWEAAPARRAPR